MTPGSSSYRLSAHFNFIKSDLAYCIYQILFFTESSNQCHSKQNEESIFIAQDELGEGSMTDDQANGDSGYQDSYIACSILAM